MPPPVTKTCADAFTFLPLDYHSLSVRSMFGQIHDMPTQDSTRSHTPFQNSSTDQTTNHDSVIQSTPGQTVATLEGHNNTFDLDYVSAGMEYPPMTPRTLWFDSFNETMPLFPTINADECYTPFQGMA